MDNIYKNIDKYNQNKKMTKYGLYLTIWSLICLLTENVTQSCNRTVYQKQKNKYFSYFYHTILCCTTLSWKFQTKESYKNLQLLIHQIIILKTKRCTTEPYSFMVNNTTSLVDNPLHFRHNLFGRKKWSWQLLKRL